MSLKSKLLFNLKEKEIPRRFSRIGELPDSIFTLTSNPYQYEIQSVVSDEVILSFIDYLVYGRDFEIHVENVIEFFLLSQEFGTLSDCKRIIKDKFVFLDELEQKLCSKQEDIQLLKAQIVQLQETVQNAMNEQQINNRIEESSSHQTNNSIASSNELIISNGNLQREVNNLSSDLAFLRDLQASQNTQIQDLNSRLNDILQQVNRQSST